jgi:hypothetical protein
MKILKLHSASILKHPGRRKRGMASQDRDSFVAEEERKVKAGDVIY